MALTDPEIVAMGYDLPTGTDWVRDGDNNISKNARTTANALHDIEENLLGDAGVSRVRGELPEEITSLDDLNTQAWNGVWSLTTDHSVGGAPFEITQTTVVEVIVGSPAAASKQVITDRYQSWWREASYSYPNEVVTWGAWHQTASAPVVSEDPYEPLSEGQTLEVLSLDHIGRDFGDGIGGFTERFDANAWQIFSTSELFDGAGLVRKNSGFSQRSILLWDRLDQFVDGEALIRGAITGNEFNSSPCGIIARDHEAGGYYTGINILSDGTIRLAITELSGTESGSTVIGAEDIEVPLNEPFFIKTAFFGVEAKAKIWLTTDSEPDWQVQAIVDETPGGWGIGKLGQIYGRWSQFFVHKGGRV